MIHFCLKIVTQLIKEGRLPAWSKQHTIDYGNMTHGPVLALTFEEVESFNQPRDGFYSELWFQRLGHVHTHCLTPARRKR